MQVLMGICIQQLYILKMNKDRKSVGYLETNDKVDQGTI